MLHRRRQKLLVDAKVQGTLISRAVLYWLYCLLSVTLLITCWSVLTQPPATSFELLQLMWSACGPTLFGSAIVMPIVLVDLLRVSNRFAGPIHRMRREMRKLASGEAVQPVQVREGDFWFDFAEDFNRIVSHVQVAKHAEPVQEEEKYEESEVPQRLGVCR